MGCQKASARTVGDHDRVCVRAATSPTSSFVGSATEALAGRALQNTRLRAGVLSPSTSVTTAFCSSGAVTRGDGS